MSSTHAVGCIEVYLIVYELHALRKGLLSQPGTLQEPFGLIETPPQRVLHLKSTASTPQGLPLSQVAVNSSTTLPSQGLPSSQHDAATHLTSAALLLKPITTTATHG